MPQRADTRPTPAPALASADVSRPASGPLFAAFLAIVYGTALAVVGGLHFDTYKDEQHFHTSAQLFSGAFPPSVEQLLSVPEVLTPLAFIVWGQLERLTGDGLAAGRALNVMISIAIVCLIALRRGRPDRDRWLAACGLLLFPYFLPLSVHLYTDVFAVGIALLGLHLHLTGRPIGGALSMILSIAARQYMVVLPTAIAAWEAMRFLRGERDRWAEIIAPGLAAGSLLGWFVFFGGLAPPAGIEVWIPPYPAPMQTALSFIPEYGLYFLACLGAYFVVPEMILFRRWPSWSGLLNRRSITIAAVLLVLFVLFPPIYPDRHQGAMDRAALWILPNALADPPRLIGFFVLAWFATVRFSRRVDLCFWLLIFSTLLQMKSQLSWDKYALPPLAFLWYLESRGRLDLSWLDRGPSARGGVESEPPQGTSQAAS